MSRFALLPAAALAALSFAGAACAADVPASSHADVAATFGNTVISLYPDGRSQKIWIQPDGTWTGVSRKGASLAGHWSQKDGKVCLRQSRPPTLPIAFCQALPADMSREVESKDVVGTPIRLRLVRGISENPG